MATVHRLLEVRVLIVGVGSRGDVAPYVGLGRRLQDSGCDVAIATHATFAAMVGDAGSEKPTGCRAVVPLPGAGQRGGRCAAEEPGEDLGVIGSVGERQETLGQLAFDEDRGPIGGTMADVEVYVVDLDVPKVVARDLAHRSQAGGHHPVPVPEGLVESIPGGFEELEALRQVGAKFGCRAPRTTIRCEVRVIPVGVQLPDLAGCRTSEDHDVRLGLVRDVRDDVAT